MNAETFNAEFAKCVKLLKDLAVEIDKNQDLIGSLSLDDYVLLCNLIKEYYWSQGVRLG